MSASTEAAILSLKKKRMRDDALQTLTELADELRVGHPTMRAWLQRGHMVLGEDCVSAAKPGYANKIGNITAARIARAVLLVNAGVSAPIAFRIVQGDEERAKQLREAVSQAVGK